MSRLIHPKPAQVVQGLVLAVDIAVDSVVLEVECGKFLTTSPVNRLHGDVVALPVADEV